MRKFLGARGAAAVGWVLLLAGPPASAQDSARYGIWFGDLHSHTAYSVDAKVYFGAHMLEDPGYACRQARAAGLDFVAITDHDVSLSDSDWRRTVRSVEDHNRPGAFTTFLGYEWTSGGSTLTLGNRVVTKVAGYGHRCVIFKSEDVPASIFRHNEEAYDDPGKLWAALSGWRDGAPATRDALTIPHSSLDDQVYELGPAFTFESDQTVDWSWADGDFQILAEIFSKHGNSEGADGMGPLEVKALMAAITSAEASPGAKQRALERLYLPVPAFERAYRDRSVQAALGRWLDRRGRVRDEYRMGLVASTDDHRALPGSTGEVEDTTHWPCNGGLAAIHAEGNTRERLWEAMRARRVYGTSGARIRLWFDGQLAGATVPMGGRLTGPGAPRFEMSAVGEDGKAIVSFEIIRNGVRVARIAPVRVHMNRYAATWTDSGFRGDAYYYVRALQEPETTYYRGETRVASYGLEPYTLSERAWSSPIWVVRGE